MHAVTFTDARQHFADTLRKVSEDAEPVRVLRRGAPDVILIDADEYAAMIETIYLFSNPANAAHINESLEQLERGDVVDLDY